jgi:hypothetical protein
VAHARTCFDFARQQGVKIGVAAGATALIHVCTQAATSRGERAQTRATALTLIFLHNLAPAFHADGQQGECT